MAKDSVLYEKYFRTGYQIRAVIRLNDKKVIDRNAEITSIEGDLVLLEILGDSLPVETLQNNVGALVSVSGGSEWGLCACNALLEKTIGPKEICLKFVDEVSEQQRREYFRLDVFVPVTYRIPEKHEGTSIKEQWAANRRKLLDMPAPVMSPFEKGYKVLGRQGSDDLLPIPVNLSGGGLRIRTPEFIQPGTTLLVDLFLPTAPPSLICAVVEVIRCNELTLRWEKDTAYITAMHFTHIDDDDRETVISFLFAEQRRNLQKIRENASSRGSNVR